MRNILIILLTLLAAKTATAEVLKCEGSYPLFKQNAEIERKLRKTGTLLAELREHTKLPEFSYYSINKYSDLDK